LQAINFLALQRCGFYFPKAILQSAIQNFLLKPEYAAQAKEMGHVLRCQVTTTLSAVQAPAVNGLTARNAFIRLYIKPSNKFHPSQQNSFDNQVYSFHKTSYLITVLVMKDYQNGNHP
jgi:hypothetical protein